MLMFLEKYHFPFHMLNNVPFHLYILPQHITDRLSQPEVFACLFPSSQRLHTALGIILVDTRHNDTDSEEQALCRPISSSDRQIFRRRYRKPLICERSILLWYLFSSVSSSH